MSRSPNRATAFTQFCTSILASVLHTVRADRAALLLLHRRSKDVESTIYVDGRGNLGPEFPIDPEIVDKVRGGIVPFTRDGERPLVCIPVISGTTLIGLVYAESLDPERFDGEKLWQTAGYCSLLANHIHRAQSAERKKRDNERLDEILATLGDVIGNSPGIRAVLRLVDKVADSKATVLIVGETGTGKEVVSKAIHRLSPRANGPCIAVNCGGFAKSLLESELFGYEKGAFTGADGLKKGKFEIANGGTIFLDEIGEMEPSSQAALLRILEDGEFYRVGGTQPVKVDVRVIAATNVNLKRAVEHGTFRKDLLYRLNVVTIALPPLRDRLEDIPLLIRHFLQKSGLSSRVSGVTDEAMALMNAHRWPGNVRELRNVIEHGATIGAEDGFIGPNDLPEEIRVLDPAQRRPPLRIRTIEFRRKEVMDTLERHNYKVSDAAAELGMADKSLYNLCASLGVRLAGSQDDDEDEGNDEEAS